MLFLCFVFWAASGFDTFAGLVLLFLYLALN